MSSTLRVICAPDKFRDALTAAQAADAMADGVRDAGADPITHPMADGGEGSLLAIAAGTGARPREVTAPDAHGRPGHAGLLLLDDGTAAVEAADAVGLAAIAPGERAVLRASSAGLAAPIRAALAAGARRIVVFLGGVATVDGGTGLLAALGARLSDEAGNRLAGGGGDLLAVTSVDLSSVRRLLAGTELIAAHDVTSPLAGPGGAAELFGPQKGATPEQVGRLDAALGRLGTLLGPAAEQPGAGAAGGLGAALMALGAICRPGAEVIAELTGLADTLAGADLCLTGEGKVDRGTAAGKAPATVVDVGVRVGVPVVVLGGTVSDEADLLYDRGAAAVLAIGRGPRTLDQALPATAADLRRAARAVCVLSWQVRLR